MKRPGFVIAALSLVTLSIYLFVTAPPPLPETSTAAAGGQVAVYTALRTVAAENDVVRALFTREIVGKGPAVGLKFDEFWRDERVEAGPLPALFLREAAASLQRSGVPLGLFLGSDFPISPSNRFLGAQAEVFEQIKQSREPQFFHAEDTGQYTAMFPDLASVQPCVTCHNEHSASPKVDWVLNDVMGATTWTYPQAQLGWEEYVRMIAAVRGGFRDAWSAYLTKAQTFEHPPEIGDRWPAEGYYLPSADVFMAEFERRASPLTVAALLSASQVPASGEE